MSVLNLRRIEETTLWKRLDTGFSGQDATVAQSLAKGLVPICEEAYNRMKAFPSLHPEYTLHDETHLLRVTELMAMVLGEDGLNKLNPIEVALLILAAHFHDQGMVLDANEVALLITDQKYMLFRQSWMLDHPTLSEVQSALNQNSPDISDLATLRDVEQQLLSALHTDYIRTTHGERSAKFILTEYGLDKRWSVNEVNLADYVAKLSKSHVKPAADLSDVNGFNYDESIGAYRVNMVFLGIVLRLADILDFDRDRTPDSLYRSIHFTSPVSLQEWEKHRSITGWNIDSTMVRFTAPCEHPVYERAIRQFMDWIDTELSACHTLVNKFPKNVEYYRLNLPLIVDRSRINPKNGAYIYHDLEFSLSRDQIVKLLMTDQLYGSVNLCIRELLQNALDALKLRRSMIRRDSDSEWHSGKVVFEHFIDENRYEIVRCVDNGVGMDIDIITKFLTSVGRSYYRSPEFEQERHSLQQANADFEPIGQFGIGFMSCFMLGDKIRIFTKKDYGQGKGHGPSLLVEINGLGGIVTIKEINDNLPVGTTVEIQCDKFEGLVNYFRTKAEVVATISEISIAPEFSIFATCTIPENRKNISIPNVIYALPTPQEKGSFKNIVTDVFEFSELSPFLQGAIKYSFITKGIDGSDMPEICIDNSEATLLPADMTRLANGTIKRQSAGWVIHKQGGMLQNTNVNRICFDGIYVCGDARYTGEENSNYHWISYITHYGNLVNSGNMTFTLNVRGLLKAPLTPARTPMNSHHRMELLPEWQRLADYIAIGQAHIYQNLIAQRLGFVNPEVYWRLIIFNKFNLAYLRMGEAWQYLSIPCISADNSQSYIKLSEIGVLTNFSSDDNYRGNVLYTKSGLACDIIDRDLWQGQGPGFSHDLIADLLMPFCALSIEDRRYVLIPRAHNDPAQLVGSNIVNLANTNMFLVPYLFVSSDVIMTAGYSNTANINNPVVRLAAASAKKANTIPVEMLCQEIIRLHRVTEEGLVEAMKGESKADDLTTRLGLFYSMVNWNNCSPDLKPPYKIHFSSGNIIELTAEVLIMWSTQDFACD